MCTRGTYDLEQRLCPHRSTEGRRHPTTGAWSRAARALGFRGLESSKHYRQQRCPSCPMGRTRTSDRALKARLEARKAAEACAIQIQEFGRCEFEQGRNGPKRRQPRTQATT